MRFDYYNILLPGSAKLDSTTIDNIKNGKMSKKKHKKQKTTTLSDGYKKQKNTQNKTVITIIFYGKF
jgi:hypothetical protein